MQRDRVRFAYADEALAITKEIRLQNGYLFDVKVNVVGPQYVLTAGTGLRNPGAEEQASRYIQPATAIAATGGPIAQVRADKAEKPVAWPLDEHGFGGARGQLLSCSPSATAVQRPRVAVPVP